MIFKRYKYIFGITFCLAGMMILVIFMNNINLCAADDEGDVSIEQVGDFEIGLHTNQCLYTKNDNIHMWGTMKYMGPEESITIEHGDPLFYMTEAKRNGVSLIDDTRARKLMLVITTMEKDEIYQWEVIHEQKIRDNEHLNSGKYQTSIEVKFTRSDDNDHKIERNFDLFFQIKN